MHYDSRLILLAGLLGLTLAGPVSADGHHQPPYYRDAQAYQPADLLTTPQEPPRGLKLLQRFHRAEAHPWSCWTHHNDLGCGSFKADCAFIFGSCRTFFGEPCRRGPIPIAVPYGYNGYYGYNGCP
jgi:hypothetical protein